MPVLRVQHESHITNRVLFSGFEYPVARSMADVRAGALRLNMESSIEIGSGPDSCGIACSLRSQTKGGAEISEAKDPNDFVVKLNFKCGGDGRLEGAEFTVRMGDKGKQTGKIQKMEDCGEYGFSLTVPEETNGDITIVSAKQPGR